MFHLGQALALVGQVTPSNASGPRPWSQNEQSPEVRTVVK